MNKDILKRKIESLEKIIEIEKIQLSDNEKYLNRLKQDMINYDNNIKIITPIYKERSESFNPFHKLNNSEVSGIINTMIR